MQEIEQNMAGWLPMINETTGVALGVVVTLVVGAFVLSRWVNGSLRIVEAEARTAREKMRREIAEDMAKLSDELMKLERAHAAFELEVAKHYASDDRMQQMEAKFTQAIDKLINRFDAFATDFHRVVGEWDASRKDGSPQRRTR